MQAPGKAVNSLKRLQRSRMPGLVSALMASKAGCGKRLASDSYDCMIRMYD